MGGPLAAQRQLARLIEADQVEVTTHPEKLAQPLRVVVPSTHLRRHLEETLVRQRGRALLGVVVQTLYAAAREVLQRAGQEVGVVGEALLPIMVERFARREQALAGLGAFHEGYVGLAGSVRDLLDAGLEAAHVEAVEERLAQLGGEEAERAAAVVRVAAKTELALAQEGVERPARVMARAAEALRWGPVLPARRVLIYGFADATALAGDLLEALIKLEGATCIVDLPPHPAEPSRWDWGAAFTAKLRERLGARQARPVTAPSPPLSMAAFEADDIEGEAREVARRVRMLLDRGVRPEDVGVVARDLAKYRDPLSRHLGRLAVPWSAVDLAGPWVPWARRVRCALELVRCGSGVPVATVLGAWEGMSPLLELGLVRAGVRDLQQLARLTEVRALPVPVSIGTGEEEVLQRPRVGEEEVREARRRARLVEEVLTLLPEPSSWNDWRNWLATLPQVLGWARDGGAANAWEGLLAEVTAQVPLGTVLERQEVYHLLVGGGEKVLRQEAGGRGGGVVVASVMAVRGWAFTQLFLLGCNRGTFPRRGEQDPLLPDRLRTALLPLLPDLPCKGDPAAEERFLFAQLCAAAGALTLSWHRQGEQGETLAPSPLLTAVPLVGRAFVPAAVQPPLAALDAACHLGLAGGREELTWFWLALAPPPAGQLARVRLAVLDEQDRLVSEASPGDPVSLVGPYLGAAGVGALPEQLLNVSRLEDLARCPWRTFVTYVLKVEPPVDPEGEVGEFYPAMIGVAVHRALERLLRTSGSGGEVVAVSVPTDEKLAEVARQCTQEVAREEGLTEAAAAVAMARVIVLLREARELLWPAGESVMVQGLECSGEWEAQVGGQGWRVRFRADLCEAWDKRARLTDFKTGYNPFRGLSPEAVTENYLKAVRRGEQLQAAVYAAASQGVGRLLFLRPEQDPELVRQVTVEADEVHAALQSVIEVLARMWAGGVVFPRLESARDGKEPRLCQRCAVQQACWRGDSGMRRRLREGARRLVATALSAGTHDFMAVALRQGWLLPLGAGAAGDGSPVTREDTEKREVLEGASAK